MATKIARLIITLLAGVFASAIGLMLLSVTPVESVYRPWVAFVFPVAAAITLILLWISMAQDNGREEK